jgi:hypothetical protein
MGMLTIAAASIPREHAVTTQVTTTKNSDPQQIQRKK